VPGVWPTVRVPVPPHGRERLGCRTCCRLVYASQYPLLKRKRKRRKPA
jgi:hypothetical protein